MGAAALFVLVLLIVGVALWSRGDENEHKAPENRDAMNGHG
jgi:hypothetical protein